MKIKNLQINVLALLFGFAAFCFVNKIEANNATKSPEGQQFFDQNGDDVSNQGKKPTKRTAAIGWDFRGPTNVSGKTTSVVSDPSNSAIVYVGAAHNGVWKSTDGGGRNWNKIPVEGNKNLYVTCLALDGNVLYAGTGGDFIGQGIYKAEGDGALKLMQGTETWTNVSKVAVADGKVYAATSQGLMCYTGGTWKVCTATKKGNTVNLDAPIRDMSVNSAGLVIAIMNQVECYISKTGSNDGFKYTEYLETVFTSAPPYILPDNMSVTTSPVDNNVLYVVAVHPNPPHDGKVFKAFLSEDQGENWNVILNWFSTDDFIDPLEGNGKNINNVYADPLDPYTLYIASCNIWKGTRYGNAFDFGLSAISTSGLPTDRYDNMLDANSPRYLHSNVRAIDFFGAYGDVLRNAYVATDGGIYRINMYITPYYYMTEPHPLHLNLAIGSYNHVSANSGINNDGEEEILMGTATLGVQAIDSFTNGSIYARYIWELNIGSNRKMSEGFGGACAISTINEKFYIYSLMLNDALVFRRTVNRGISFQPIRSEHNMKSNVEWFIPAMLPGDTDAPKYDAPMAMWESFDDTNTFDAVWFKADKSTNFFEEDNMIYAQSKNFDYPIAYPKPANFTHGDSIQLPDPVQNRFFVGLQHKVFMTREALMYEKTSTTDTTAGGPGKIIWFNLAELNTKDITTAFALSDDANTLYVGTEIGNVYCYTNLKEVHDSASMDSLQQHLAYEFANKKVRAMAVDPADANHVVVVLEGGGNNVYETFDGLSKSATFNLIKGGLPNNVYTVLFPKGAKKGTIMVGTEEGIWMKESGSEWVFGGLDNIPVMTLTQLTTHRPGVKNVPYLDGEGNLKRMNYPSNNNSYLTIYAGTYGSGVFSSRAYVGIEEPSDNPVKESNALVIFPNPVTETATIELDMTKGNATIQVFNIDGRLIKEQTAKTNVNTINFKDYVPGTYIIQVIQNGAIKSGKVIKQ